MNVRMAGLCSPWPSAPSSRSAALRVACGRSLGLPHCPGASGPLSPEAPLGATDPAINAIFAALRYTADVIGRLSFLCSVALLAACGDEAAKPPVVERDPAITGALGDPIMTDPDLSGQNQANAGLSGLGTSNVEIPPQDRGPDAIAAARATALKLAGGRITAAPAPATGGAGRPAQGAVTAAQLAGATHPQCAARAQYSARWAALLPEALDVYPRGAVQEAAGTDEAGCRLRVVNFRTPVAPGEVIDFYYARLRKAGYTARRAREGSDDVLGGTGSGTDYVIYVRTLDKGMTEVELVLNAR
jgi:hypothetical protein